MLVFEPHITGHRSEYLAHLMSFVCSGELEDQYDFVTNAAYSIPAYFSNRKHSLKIERLPAAKATSLLHGNLLTRGWKYYFLAKRCAKKIAPSQFLFLWFNDVQLMLGLFGFPCSTSGILFKPFIRMDRNDLSSKIIWMRKWAQTWLLTNHRVVKTIWLLDDEWAVNELNARFQTNKFKVLPEPVSSWVAEPGYQVREAYKIDQNRILLIHIGTLSTRKGSLEILKSLKHLDNSTNQKLTLLMVGQPQPGHEMILRRELERVNDFKNIQLIFKPQYLKEPRLQAVIEQCDGILTPYFNTESSSGILARAILNRIPVLGVRKGLMGETIKKYDAGVLIDESTPEEIAKGILQLINKTIRRKQAPTPVDFDYKKIHDPKEFAKRILS